MISTAAPGARVLVVEDEEDIQELLVHNLRREGYRPLTASDGEEALQEARRSFPDLILLDRLLPRVSGTEVCRRLKQDPDLRSIPVIMVTALSEREDVIGGLESGADDYVSKPFDLRELLARVRAVLRRNSWDAPDNEERLVRGPIVIDQGRHQVYIEGEPVEMTATEFRLLHYLAASPGRVFPRAQLVQRVIGGHGAVIDRNIDVHVGSIRKKLAAHRKLIETVRGVGYRFSDRW
jgi:two-component system phosphate regulon response regulator PhoB